MNGRWWHGDQIDQSHQNHQQTILWYHVTASVDFGVVTSILRMQPCWFNFELARFDLCLGLD
jgi:hypothetical protein